MYRHRWALMGCNNCSDIVHHHCRNLQNRNSRGMGRGRGIVYKALQVWKHIRTYLKMRQLWSKLWQTRDPNAGHWVKVSSHHSVCGSMLCCLYSIIASLYLSGLSLYLGLAVRAMWKRSSVSMMWYVPASRSFTQSFFINEAIAQHMETMALRHILKHLCSCCLITPFKTLTACVGVQLESLLVTQFYNSIVSDGNWTKAEHVLQLSADRRPIRNIHVWSTHTSCMQASLWHRCRCRCA